MTEQFSLINDLKEVDAMQWNRLAGDNPLVQHSFLHALHQTGCASARTGWAPHYLILRRNNTLAGAIPMYLKSHSRGEYVFDYVWARAFEQHGLDYYPKLVVAVPFSPVQGPRLLAHSHADKVLLARQAAKLTRQNQLSSLHVLFPCQNDQAALEEAGFVFRDTVQFHWQNQGYENYSQFLGSMSQKNRKKRRQDSRKVEEAGVRFEWLEGSAISPGALQFFYECYCQTYLERGQAPYLDYAFFAALLASMPHSLLLIVAWQSDRRIACALNIRSSTTLYGRYWGALRFVSGLHFETCYTQGIDYCIQNRLQTFEGGAQGEHKLSRGLLPVVTPSAHWISDPRYADAIKHFVAQESSMVENYVDELHEHSPFKTEAPICTR